MNAANYADRITVRKATGYSPYYLLHGVHPLLPRDLTDATFLVSKFRPGMTTDELIQARAWQLLRLPKDIARARKILQKSRFRSKEAHEKKFTRQLWKESFDPGDLVLVWNNRIENSVSIERKTADRYTPNLAAGGSRVYGSQVCRVDEKAGFRACATGQPDERCGVFSPVR